RCMFALAFFSAFAREHPTSPLFPYTTLFRSDDEQARYIEASFSGGTGEEVRVGSLYLPNGNPIGTDKFTYKLAWMERLHDRAEDLLKHEIPFVLAGDYNICPTDEDVYDPVALRDDALCQPESRSRFRALLYLGLTDA